MKIGGTLLKDLKARIDYSRDMIDLVSLKVSLPFIYEEALVTVPPKRIIKTLRINSEINMEILNDLDLRKGLNTVAAIYQVDAKEKI